MSKVKEFYDEQEGRTQVSPPVQTTDGWDTIPDTGAQLIVGPLVKFKDDEWYADKVQFPTDGLAFAVVAVRSAWVKFDNDGKPEHRLTESGQRHPERNDLPDLDESLWKPGLDRQPEDPWKDTRYVLLINTATAAEYTFATDTYGGRRAVFDLKRQVDNMRCVHPGAVPIVSLTSTSMPTRFGPKPRPVLKVVDWRGVANEPPKQIDRPEYAADRIGTHPRRMQDEPPPHTEVPPAHDDDEITF